MLLLIITLTACQTTSQTGALTGAVVGSAVGAVAANDHKTGRGAAIGGLIGAGIGYLIGSNIENNKQQQIMEEYNYMLGIKEDEPVKNRINLIGDRILGNKDGFTDVRERDIAINELTNALNTAADIYGDRDGFTRPYEIHQYIKTYGDCPLIRIINEQRR